LAVIVQFTSSVAPASDSLFTLGNPVIR
jgi:hypothetical protein